MQFLQAPAALHELDRQPVEQLRVRRRRALTAEVVLGLDNPSAEVLLPHAIDGHARGQRVTRIHQPAGKVKPVGGAGSRHERRQHGWHAGLESCSRPREIAGNVDVSLARLALGQHQGSHYFRFARLEAGTLGELRPDGAGSRVARNLYIVCFCVSLRCSVPRL